MKEKQQVNCATCEHNVFNVCMSYHGYYFHGEAIGDEEVECEDWVLNPYSYPTQLKLKKIKLAFASLFFSSVLNKSPFHT